jgi:AraC family transcriptional regulator
MTDTHPFQALPQILPILIHIQTHLDEGISLHTLAERANLSPYHFHRVFKSATGETPKGYTQRLRLERSAFQMMVREATILDIAVSCGYRSHETYSRAFKRHFGLTPKVYRRKRAHLRASPPPAKREPLNWHTQDYEISRTTVQTIRPLPVIFIRHLGPYVDVDPTLFDRLIDWAKEKGLYTGENLLLGIGHDGPNVTPPEKLRFDACLQIDGPVKPTGEIGFQTTPGGSYAVTSYTGPFGPTLERAYEQIFGQILQLKGYTLIGLPIIEIYSTTTIDPDYSLNHADIYVPVEKNN